jgi:hypothetical protein
MRTVRGSALAVVAEKAKAAAGIGQRQRLRRPCLILVLPVGF